MDGRHKLERLNSSRGATDFGSTAPHPKWRRVERDTREIDLAHKTKPSLQKPCMMERFFEVSTDVAATTESESLVHLRFFISGRQGSLRRHSFTVNVGFGGEC